VRWHSYASAESFCDVTKCEINWAGQSTIAAGHEIIVSIETEIKIKIGDAEDFVRKLLALDARIQATRHFEDNYLLDFPDQRLKSSQCLVRVRYARDLAFLTYKGPPRAAGIFKTREELETRLEDGSVTLKILEQLGMQAWFRYQKYRQEFELDGVQIAVDETPVGSYVEFEGSEEAIHSLAAKMGIDSSRFLKVSYYALYLDQCRQKGKTPGPMVFES
jgi:adenylate cyclase, class 2